MSEQKAKNYPERKQHELSEIEKIQIRVQIKKGDADIYKIAKKFNCSPSQIAGIKAGLTKSAIDSHYPSSDDRAFNS
jgi:hypothetical protein